jgi:anti-sigma regulatory factor (Ser/Thr protein kinase)/putative methionine-R-sulfoxide reductase with GAF domain
VANEILSDTAEARLRRIELVTDAALAHLDVEDLLVELLDRVRELLEVDTAAVLLLDQSGQRLVATAARGIEEEVRQGVRIPLGRGFAGRIALEKRPVIIEHVDHTNVLNPILRDRGIQSLLGVPLLSSGEMLGVMHVGTLHHRVFDDGDIELLQLVADRVALATQSRLSHVERAAALALQRSLLPGLLPAIPGLSLSARYVAGEEGGLGGDWYDAVLLPSGRFFIAIGDVVGRGLRAAVVMGRMRSTIRAYALTSSDPAEILALADRKLQHFEPGEMATVMVGLFDPSLETIELASAGHPPPVLAGPDAESMLIDIAIGPPIGVPTNTPRKTTTIAVPSGAVLCFYTDGLIERRGEAIDDRIAQLRSLVFADDPDSVCSSVMRGMVGNTEPSDDIAVLAVRRQDADSHPPLDIHIRAVPASLHHIRAALRRWLTTAVADPDEANDILLAVGEATANAVEHAYDSSGGALAVHVELNGSQVLIQVIDSGGWRTTKSENRGRGTQIMERCTDELEIHRRADGTEVRMRRQLRHTAS